MALKRWQPAVRGFKVEDHAAILRDIGDHLSRQRIHLPIQFRGNNIGGEVNDMDLTRQLGRNLAFQWLTLPAPSNRANPWGAPISPHAARSKAPGCETKSIRPSLSVKLKHVCRSARKKSSDWSKPPSTIIGGSNLRPEAGLLFTSLNVRDSCEPAIFAPLGAHTRNKLDPFRHLVFPGIVLVLLDRLAHCGLRAGEAGKVCVQQNGLGREFRKFVLQRRRLALGLGRTRPWPRLSR